MRNLKKEPPVRCLPTVFIYLLFFWAAALVSPPAVCAAEPDGPLPALTASAGFWADIDKDGLMDVLLTGSTVEETITRLYRNNGDGTFHDLNAGFAALGQAVAAWRDYDNDGDLDLAIAGQDNAGRAVTQIYRHEGGGAFTNIDAALEGVIPTIVQWLDFDNDGDEDLYVSGARTALYRNEQGRFLFQSTRPKPLRQGVWGDFDGDGDLDLISRGVIQLNEGDGRFTLVRRTDLADPRYGSLAADFDEDGDLDTAAIGDLSGGVLAILKNDGAAGFQPEQQILPIFPDVARWGDFDGDNELDLLIAGYYEIRVYQQPDRAGIALIGESWHHLVGLPGIYFGGLNHTDWVDIDGDGDLDIFYTGPRTAQPGDYVTDFYTNTMASSHSTVAAPTNLRTSANGDEIRFQWDSPQTPATGLTYNLRIGTSPGGIEAVAPHASSSTGRRWLHASGNASIWNQHWLRLPIGRYYWSVQAINAAYVGGMFAEEGTFEITNSRPFISELADRTTPISQPTLPVPFTVSDAQTPSADLLIVASSSDTNLVPADQIVFDGGGSNRTFRIYPAHGATGQVTIMVTVRDPQGAESSSRFELTVPPQFKLLELPLPKLINPILSWGDMDGDDDLDMIVGGTNPQGRTVIANGQVYTVHDGVLSVLGNNGDGNLTDTGVPVLGISHFPDRANGLKSGSVAMADVEGDGDMDLLVIGDWSDLYKNSGTATFSPTGAGFPVVGGKPFIAWQDFDGDGRPDIIMDGHVISGGPMTRLYRNLGAGTFGFLKNLPGDPTSSGAWMDVDNDGDADLLLGLPDRTRLYRNDGRGELTDMGLLLPRLTFCSIVTADFNGDGWMDFILSGTTNEVASGAVTQLYLNERDGTFNRAESPFIPVYSGALSAVDYDNDGNRDLLIAGSTTNAVPVTRLYRNEGGGVFAEDNVGLPDLAVPAVAWADFDLDGDLDLAISGTTTNGLFSGLFRNDRGPSNTRPDAPATLQATLLSDNGVSLDWTTGSDVETTNSAVLTYAIRVGTNSGGQGVVASLSGSASGFRRLAQPGQRHRSLRLPDLPRGEYFWSVQTIDSAFEGSAFATEVRIAITNSRPTISGLSDLRTIPDTVVSNVAVKVGDLETPASELRLTVTSSDTNLVPVNNIYFFGSGSNRTMTILPTSLVGTAVVTVTVWDSDDGKKSSSFAIRVDEFTEQSPLALNMSVSSFDWGDYDNDGDLDLLAIGTASGTNFTKLYRNDSHGVFEEVPTELPTVGTGNALWSDFDNDGYLEMLLVGGAGSHVLKNTRDGNFVDVEAGLLALSNSSAVCFDYDGDGDTDILISGFELGRGSIARLYRNEGGHIFSITSVRLPGATRGTIATGDLDNDGDLDLLMSGRVDDEQGTIMAVSTQMFRNNGEGAFFHMFPSLPAIARSVALGDYDNDGDLDILMNLDNSSIGGSSSDRLYLFRNDNAWVFTEVMTTLPIMNRGTVAWGDYDNDGLLDALVSGFGSSTPVRTRIFKNRGSNDFVDILAPLTQSVYGDQSRSSDSGWADYDNDQRLDFALSGASVSLTRNLVPSRNSLPTPPTRLTSVVSAGGRVLLEWTGAADQEPSGQYSLRYNIRLGVTPGGEQIMSAASDPSTGRRRLANFGNAGTTNMWQLTLRPGTYYWSVQAIDVGLAGSTFSQEYSFTITAPSITRFSIESTGEFQLRFTGTPGLSYSVLASSNLADWTVLGPAVETIPGVFEFMDDAPDSRSRFYRIQSP